ncbi:hypothetical protein HPB49_015069 [Dermacentor silvarum]|uniref:Uncharacterized protein n=1 Tax=Dermacentor silvarum TaxID=543639 RepID=A0ACB8CRV5_DERSI|nr:hypothetical protein HPB49_015069 [Dermacentor silvarum]
MDDNFAEFVNYLDRHEEILSGAAFSYASPPRRVPRDRLNPMEVYDESTSDGRFRVSKSAVQQLLAILPLRDNTDGPGTFQIVTGDLVNVSQPTVSRVIERVSIMIARTLRHAAHAITIRFFPFRRVHDYRETEPPNCVADFYHRVTVSEQDRVAPPPSLE